jgi:uncharacterized membrane protein YeaQ/YmgE (transglycosylase-associated protein family)
MLILFIIVWGMAIGWIAWMLVRGREPVQWGTALGAGLAGSFVGGLLVSLISGDGVELKASGIIGSIVGAILVLLLIGLVQRGSRSTS